MKTKFSPIAFMFVAVALLLLATLSGASASSARDRLAPAPTYAVTSAADSGVITLCWDLSASSGVWSPTGGPYFDGGYVLDLAVDQATPGLAYAVVDTPGAGIGAINPAPGFARLFQTINGGITWTLTLSGATSGPQPQAVAVSGTLVLVGYKNCHRGDHVCVQRSTDGGVAWSPVYTFPSNLAGGDVADLSMNPADLLTALAVGGQSISGPGNPTAHGVILRTTDGGITWTHVFTDGDGTDFNVVAWNGVTPTLALVGGNAIAEGSPSTGTIFYSADGGLHWTLAYTTGAAVIAVAFDQTSPGIAYAAASNGAFYRSADAGQNWVQVSSNGPQSTLAQRAGLLYGGRGAAVITSTDMGSNWTTTAGTIAEGLLSALATEPYAGGAALYAGSNVGGVFLSNDDGATFVPQRNGMAAYAIPKAIVTAPDNPGWLAVAAGTNAVFTSTDGGTNWTRLATPPAWFSADAIRTLAPSQANPQTLYVGGGDLCDRPTLYRSPDWGITWTPIYTASCMDVPQSNITGVAFHPVTPTLAYATGNWAPGEGPPRGVIWRSADGGLTWTMLMSTTLGYNFRALTINPLTPTMLFVGATDLRQGPPTSALVRRSVDSGLNWTTVLTYTPAGPPPSPFAGIAVDYRDGQTVYAVTDAWYVQWTQARFYKSSDAGLTWTNVYTSNGDQLVMDPTLPNILYLAGDGWAGYSINQGNSWTPITSNVPGVIQSLAVDRRAGRRTLYAGALGVWMYSAPVPNTIYLPMILHGF